MRILQVYPYYYPAWNYGGVTRVVYEISKRLCEMGHDVTVYTTDALDSKSRIRIKSNPTIINGVKTFYFKNLSNYLTYKHHIPLPLEMPLKIKNEVKRYDIVHLHGYHHMLNVIVHYYAKKIGVPYVLQPHGSLPRIIEKQGLKKLYDWVWGYKILKDASKVIALTKTEAEQCKMMGVDEDKIEIIPNGIDLSEYENPPGRGEFRKKYLLNEKIILYLGRVHKIKGLDLFARAFAELSKEIDNVKLVIAGPDDGYLTSLKKLVADLEISDKVLFTGPLYGEEKLRAYVDADVYVLPSVYETFPVAVLEACACGVPVIVTDRCGIADIVDNKVGYMVEYNKDQLKSAMIKVLNDEGLRRRFGEEGKRLVRDQFSWDVVVAKVENIYRNVTRSG